MRLPISPAQTIPPSADERNNFTTSLAKFHISRMPIRSEAYCWSLEIRIHKSISLHDLHLKLGILEAFTEYPRSSILHSLFFASRLPDDAFIDFTNIPNLRVRHRPQLVRIRVRKAP
jgi:hypothetical protein